MEGDVLQGLTSGQDIRFSVIGNTHKVYLPNIKCSSVDCSFEKDNRQIQMTRDWHVAGTLWLNALIWGVDVARVS
jgi:hypothetical protein